MDERYEADQLERWSDAIFEVLCKQPFHPDLSAVENWHSQVKDSALTFVSQAMANGLEESGVLPLVFMFREGETGIGVMSMSSVPAGEVGRALRGVLNTMRVSVAVYIDTGFEYSCGCDRPEVCTHKNKSQSELAEIPPDDLTESVVVAFINIKSPTEWGVHTEVAHVSRNEGAKTVSVFAPRIVAPESLLGMRLA